MIETLINALAKENVTLNDTQISQVLSVAYRVE